MSAINKIFIVILFFFISFGYAVRGHNYVVSGDYVYVNDSKALILAYPHTIHSSGWVYFNITSKKYSGDVDAVLGFNTTEAKPVRAEVYHPHWVNWTTETSMVFYNVSSFVDTDEPCDFGHEYNTYHKRGNYTIAVYDNTTNSTVWSVASAVVCFDSFEKLGNNDYNLTWSTRHSRLVEWKRLDKFKSINHEFGGMNKWYYTKGASINTNKNYFFRVYVRVPVSLTPSRGKYWFAIKPSDETIQQAISNGHLYYLDPWWDSNWNYRRNITIDNSANSNTLTDYQVPINVTYDSNMQSDFDDLRFTYYNSTDDSETELSYWIENKTDSGWAYVWVKVPEIPANGYSTVYMYYGNSLVSSASNGNDTFILFDDFEDGDVNGWSCDTVASISIETTEAFQGSYSAKISISGSPGGICWLTQANDLTTYRYHGTIKRTDMSSDNGYGGIRTSTGCYYAFVTWRDGTVKKADPGWVNFANSNTNWATFNITRGTDNFKAITWNASAPPSVTSSYTNSNPKADYGSCFGGYNGYFLIDNVFIAEWTDPEPTYLIGAEEGQIQISNLECYTNNTAWVPCNYLTVFNWNFSQIRVNCSSGLDITNVYFLVKDVYDNNIRINYVPYDYMEGTTTNKRFYLNESMAPQVVNDSGDWVISVKCELENSENSTLDETWDVPWGWVEVALTSPTTDISVTQNDTFWLNGTVTCHEGECASEGEQLKVWADPFGNIYAERVGSSYAEPVKVVKTTKSKSIFSVMFDLIYNILSSIEKWFGRYV